MAPVWLRYAVSPAVNGNEFDLRFGIAVPEHLLDLNAVGRLNLGRFRYGCDVVEVREILT